MIIIARLFRLLFALTFTRKYYFGLYKRFFRPYNIFRGVSSTSQYLGRFRMRVDLDEWIQQNIFFFGVYDEAGIRLVKSVLSEGDVFLDIGANVGCFTLVASEATGRKGKVIAFEAVRRVADRLEENIGLNGLENVSVVRKAVYDRETLLRFYIASQENLGMSSIFHHDTESGVIENVPAIDLDHFLKDYMLDGIKMIKIDVEGAEIFALRGMKETIKRFKPLILVEVSPQVTKEFSDRKLVFDFFSGYRL